MFKSLLGIDESQNVVDFNVYFRSSWILAIVLIAAAVAFSVYLYRSERELPARWRRLLTACHVIALVLLIVLVLQPVAEFKLAQPQRSAILVLLDTSESMGIKDERRDDADVIEAARLLGKAPFAKDSPFDARALANQIQSVSRSDLARAAMEHPQIRLVENLVGQFDVRFFTFDEQVRPQGDAGQPVANETGDGGGKIVPASMNWLETHAAAGQSSQIGSAIDDAVARFAGQPIAGVVVLSDFAWIEGKDPVTVARQLKKDGIPIYTVPIGLPSPPDIHLRRIIAPDVVFKGDKVPIRVQIDSKGFEGDSVDVVLTIDGDTSNAIRKQVDLVGGAQFEELTFTPNDASGSLQLDVTIAARAGEASDANNQIGHSVRILDEKIKVLYIEGMPRWEYRYLRWVLLRDQRLNVTFLMTQGDPELARTSTQHLSAFPQDAKDAFKYDLIILGDVPASYFKPDQVKLIDDLVRNGGGSLLMVAGPMNAPTSYRDTTLGDLLPVTIGPGQWQLVGNEVHPVVTPEGRESSAVSLGDTDEQTDKIWEKVNSLYALPPLIGAKPGATILLSLPKESDEIRGYPMVAWQRIKKGKSMFVGTEELWRMRKEVGDRHHARFWSQTIQFLTLSRLLGENKPITLETDRMAYNSGEQVKLYANVLDDSFQPIDQASYSVVLAREGDADSAVDLELVPVPGSPGLFSGMHFVTTAGKYKLTPRSLDVANANQAEFQVVDLPLEKREAAAHHDLAQKIADVNGGKVFQLSDLVALPDEFKGYQQLQTMIRIEKDLWDLPLFFILLVLVTGFEWYFRRRHNLV